MEQVFNVADLFFFKFEGEDEVAHANGKEYLEIACLTKSGGIRIISPDFSEVLWVQNILLIKLFELNIEKAIDTTFLCVGFR